MAWWRSRRGAPGAAGCSSSSSAEEMLTISSDGMLRDEADRVMVNIVVDGRSGYDAVRAAVSCRAGRLDHRRGQEVPCRASSKALCLGVARRAGQDARRLRDACRQRKPTTNVGTATTQGIVQHRVDQLPPNLDGTGITIGIISDSYNTARNFVAGGTLLTIHEAQDIASCDLPGTGNPCGNTQPVVVLKDFGTFPNTSGDGRGRGMAQLIHDMVPKARLGFATANDGEVQFANTSARWRASRARPLRGPASRRRSSSTTCSTSTKACSPTPWSRRPSTTSRRSASRYFSSAGNTRADARLRVGSSHRARRRRDRRDQHQSGGASPPTCTPAASTTSAAMAAWTLRRPSRWVRAANCG